MKSNKLFLILVVLACIVFFIYNLPFEYRTSVDNYFYTIVIDAGSTGSRIHVFKLDHDKNKNDVKLDIKLVNEELFVKIKPGLSSFSKSPDEATGTIKPLLDKALTVIPKKYHELTRFSLKATAGLRMISDKIANQILENIRGMLKKYPFANTENDVSILDGKYEGIYSWVTLNYALNNFEYSKEAEVVSLDLGGGSTQVTFLPSSQNTIKNNDYIVDFKIDTVNYKIYAKSFLGFGLMSARMNIFRVDTLRMLIPNANNQSKQANELMSVCLQPETSFVWIQQGVEYTVKGPTSKQQHSFEKCYANVLKTIQNKINAPVELNNKEIYAFSFYFDRLNNAKLFKDSTGGLIEIKSILNKAISVCNKLDSDENANINKNDKDYSFLCMDLTFIYALLSQGFGLPDYKQINVHNEVNRMEISWALGAAFHMLND